MSNFFNSEQIEIINDKETIKVIATQSKKGKLHVVFKGSIHVNVDGNLEFYEIIESSQNNRNFVNSIWFNKEVAINVLGKDGRSYLIHGKVKQAVIAGEYFQQAYENLVNSGRVNDLSTIWIIEPTEIKDETFKNRVSEEEKLHPHIIHLDRIRKNEE